MAARATAYLRQAGELLLTDLVAAEMVYVLESFDRTIDRVETIQRIEPPPL